MTEEMRKRLEEAARKEIPDILRINVNYVESFITGFCFGAEYSYKEAIEQAKEWMRNYFPDELDGKGFEFVSRDEILADFETDMNKLWEEKK